MLYASNTVEKLRIAGAMKRQRDQIRATHERPAGREHYFLVLANGEIKHFPSHDTLFDYEVWEFGNCFRQKREAEHARDSIKHLLLLTFRANENRFSRIK
jgi:hypothetical protein